MPELYAMPFTNEQAGLEGSTSNKDKVAGVARVEKLQEWLRDAESSTSETKFQEEALEDYKFYSGDQDTAEVLEDLERQKRPATTFNEVKPKIDMLVGLAAQTKYETLVVPVGPEDEPLAELMNGAYKHYYKVIKLNRKELECFEHTVKCGRSLLFFYIDTSNPFKPVIKATRYPSSNYRFDPDSIEYDHSDARYLFLDKWLTEEEVQQTWPEFNGKEAVGFAGEQTKLPEYFNEANDKYRIIECWYTTLEEVLWFINPMTNQPESLTPSDFSKFTKALQEGVPTEAGPVQIDPSTIETYKRFKKVYNYSIFCGNFEFEFGKSPYKFESFPGIEFGAYKDYNYNRWFGVINAMKDPQKALNTMRRQHQHLLQTLPKGILVHETGAVLNIEEYQTNSSEPNFHMEVVRDGLQKYKFETQPQISPVYNILDERYSDSIKRVSGIEDPMMGAHLTSREPGVTLRIKQETNIAVLYTLFDNFRESRYNAGKILLSLIQQYVTMPTVIRIEGEQGMQLAQINTQMNRDNTGFNDITTGEFDLEIEDSLQTATMRATIAQILTEFAHNNPGAIPPDILLEYSGIPYSAKQKVKQYYEAMMKQQQENQEREFEIQEAELAIKAEAASNKGTSTPTSKKEK